MNNYERFGEDQTSNAHTSVDLQAVDETSSDIKDVHIKVDKDQDDIGTLKIYSTETKQGVEYIDDPSAKQQLSLSQSLQASVKRVIEHPVFRIVLMLLILLDFTLVIIDLAGSECSSDDTLENISHVIISLFLLEVFARLFYEGRQFFRSIIDVIDGIVVVVSFIVDMVFVALADSKSCQSNYARLLVIGRVFRIIRILRILYIMVQQKRHVAAASRRVISQNKRRYQKDGFDLDLCYITERVIAMSFPSKGMMAMYRNPVEEVARFFNTKHKDHYRIYNLCSERDYDETLFHNRVERIFIDDHNVPRVREMIEFCDNAREFMAQDQQNVISIHCKGGKGRTGTMICVWLIECGLFDGAEESLEYFGDRRTDLSVGKKFQGVETPSQSRYVGYFEKVKKKLDGKVPAQVPKKISTIKIFNITGVGNADGKDLSMEIRVDGLLIYECNLGQNINCTLNKLPEDDSIEVKLENVPVLTDDVKVRFFSSDKNVPKIYDHCAFFFWFHTAFIEDNRLVLTREELDNPHKKEGQKFYHEKLMVEVLFEDHKED
ncbi:phosphatidylinositol 3,4,5-trisphosphate 3-phosphatase TPTE2-like [Mytilus edulis]|uniref:phosphatidylinositol 3,4,5-trisphosphate 3-phosphatase TPTE2-like n=1 Tax=Mytilus edulis TaxID=6550 RepID=UPI0039EE536D